MIKVDIDTSGFAASLDDMVQQINAFPEKMAQEMTDWQTEDMHRKYPNTVLKDKTVETDIWPRSRTSDTPRRLGVRLLRRRNREKRARGTGTKVQQPSTRPILRESLWDQLCTRMTMLLDTIRWK